MAKDQNTYAKRARETEKRRKAEAKRERRRKKREEANAAESVDDGVPADMNEGPDSDSVASEDVEP